MRTSSQAVTQRLSRTALAGLLAVLFVSLFFSFTASLALASERCAGEPHAQRIHSAVNPTSDGQTVPEDMLCAPDGRRGNVELDGEVVLDFGEGNEINGGPDWDLYFYEWQPSGSILLDWIRIEVAPDNNGEPGEFRTVFVWGDGNPANNGSLFDRFPGEAPEQPIKVSQLLRTNTEYRAIGIEVGTTPQERFRFLRITPLVSEMPPQYRSIEDPRPESDAFQRVHAPPPLPPTATLAPVTPEPATVTAEPPTGTPEPATATAEPPTGTPEPATATAEPATATAEPPTVEPSATSVPPTTAPPPPTETFVPSATPVPTSAVEPTLVPTALPTDAPPATAPSAPSPTLLATAPSSTVAPAPSEQPPATPELAISPAATFTPTTAEALPSATPSPPVTAPATEVATAPVGSTPLPSVEQAVTASSETTPPTTAPATPTATGPVTGVVVSTTQAQPSEGATPAPTRVTSPASTSVAGEQGQAASGLLEAQQAEVAPNPSDDLGGVINVLRFAGAVLFIAWAAHRASRLAQPQANAPQRHPARSGGRASPVMEMLRSKGQSVTNGIGYMASLILMLVKDIFRQHSSEDQQGGNHGAGGGTGDGSTPETEEK